MVDGEGRSMAGEIMSSPGYGDGIVLFYFFAALAGEQDLRHRMTGNGKPSGRRFVVSKKRGRWNHRCLLLGKLYALMDNGVLVVWMARPVMNSTEKRLGGAPELTSPMAAMGKIYLEATMTGKTSWPKAGREFSCGNKPDW